MVPAPAAGAEAVRAGDWPSLTAISVATSAITTATLPPASRTRPRTWALRSAARLAASFCRALPALSARAAVRACAALVRIALPMRSLPISTIYVRR